jgi:Uma2 family endonuclease
MSTITTLPKSTPVAPSTTSRRDGLAAGEQRIAIRGLSWDLYDRLSNAISDDQHIRLTYDGKDLEIMVTGIEHEDYKHLVTLFIEIVTTACRIRGRLAGQTTWKRPEVERGLEADQCGYFDPHKLAAVAKARAAGCKDITDYPNPDLAIEIDISRSQVDRPSIYAALKVAEVWRFDGADVVIDQLGPDGQYAASQRSRWLPVGPEDVRRWLVSEDSSDMLDWKHRLAEWAKGLAESEANGD